MSFIFVISFFVFYLGNAIDSVPPDCSVDGLYCVIDGIHDYEYYECSPDFKGFRQCAPGTKCAGEQKEPYTYNPCVEYNQSEIPSHSSTKPTSSEVPVTPSVGGKSSEIPVTPSEEYNPMECKIQGLFCVMDGIHNNEYYECSPDFKGFRQCAPGTKCKGEQSEPYTYNPCVIDSYLPSDIPSQSSSTINQNSSEVPVTPSVGKPSSEIPVTSSCDYNPIECKVDGLYCVMDGNHDYEYYECSPDFKGFRQCAPGTKCKGEQLEPYTYNPCIEYNISDIPSHSSTKPTSSEPTTPSVGKPSSEIPVTPSEEYNPMNCSVNGLFCIIDGIHDYEYYECSPDFKGFRPCAPGTKCKGEQLEPYTYNPCIEYNQSEIPSHSSTKPTSSEVPVTPSVGGKSSEIPVTPSCDYNPIECKIQGLFCIMDGNHDYEYYECSSGYQGFRQCAQGTKCKGEQKEPYTYNPCVEYNQSEIPSHSSTKPISSEVPVTPSVGGKSSEIPVTPSCDYNPMECKIQGLFCIMDGNHDYEYYECSSGYQGFRQCAQGTKCAGEQKEPYTYNPCIIDPRQTPIQSSETPTTPSVGEPSSENTNQSTPIIPVPTDCSVDGFFCVVDGIHDYQYLECSEWYKGFRPCAPGTKCRGEKYNPFSYNPCVTYVPYNPPIESCENTTKPTESSETPTTPSVGKPSSETPVIPSGEYNPMECKIQGLYCIMDGNHDYEYYECSSGYQGFRQCAPGTKCKGEQSEPYTYNPCIEYNQSEIPSHSSTKPTSSEVPVTPSVGVSSNVPVTPSCDYNPMECKVEGLFCIMDGNHDYEYYECSSGYQGFRQCAPGTKCAGQQDEPYKFNPCIIIDPRENPTESCEKPTTPSVGKPSSEIPIEPEVPEVISCGEFECPEDGLYCQIDGTRNNRYCECATTFKGSRPCAPGTWCNGEQTKPYDYNPCVFIDQTTWFGNVTYSL